MDERNLPELLRTAERRVNQHVWGDRRAIVSIPARPDEDVDLLLMEAANVIELRARQVAAIVTWLEANQPDVFRRGLWDAIPKPTDSASGDGQ